MDKKTTDAATLVQQLLDEAAKNDRNKVTIRQVSTPDDSAVSTQLPEIELSAEELESPEDAAALLSILVSVLATILGSTFTGFTRAARDDMLPNLGKELMHKTTSVKPEHYEFAIRLLRPAMDAIVKDDEAKTLDQIIMPMNLNNAVLTLLSFGMAMHRIGKNGGELHYNTGLKAALHKATNKLLSGTGVITGEGTLDHFIHKAIDKHVADAKRIHEAGNE